MNGNRFDGLMRASSVLARFVMLALWFYLLPESKAQMVALGSSHSTYLCVDHSVIVYGTNSQGQHGVGDKSFKFAPSRVTFPSGIEQVIALGNLNAAIDSSGNVYFWGIPETIALGMPNAPIPITSPLPPKYAMNVRSISIGANHIVYLLKDSTVRVSGDDRYGTLGGGKLEFPDSGWADPMLIKIIKVQSVGATAFALDVKGHLWAWGANYGNIPGENAELVRVPTRIVTDLEPIQDIEVASYDAEGSIRILTTDGTVFGWGGSSSGQLGFVQGRVTTPVKLVHTGGPIIEMAAGERHTLLLDNNGNVFASGRNVNGQLGLGSNEVVVGFHQIESLPRIRKISAGGDVSVAFATNGQVFIWGLNTSYQISYVVTDHSVNSPIVLDTDCNLTSGIEHHDVSTSFNAHPNPTTGIVNIPLKTSGNSDRIEVTRTDGQRTVVPYVIQNRLVQLDFTGFSAGIYYVLISNVQGRVESHMVLVL